MFIYYTQPSGGDTNRRMLVLEPVRGVFVTGYGFNLDASYTPATIARVRVTLREFRDIEKRCRMYYREVNTASEMQEAVA